MNLHWNRRKCFCLLAAAAILTTLAVVLHAAQKPVCKKLAEGTPAEARLTILEGERPGPALFVVGGVHGDETAGWTAADRLAKEARILSGALYIVSPANAWGAARNNRLTAENRDLNRLFPGRLDGDASEQLAAELFAEIEQAAPEVVFDLHESLPKRANRDDLGSSIIFDSIDGIEDLVLGMLLETQSGSLCSGPFTCYTGAPIGSINRVVNDALGLRVLTVETFRGDDLEKRVQDHLDLIHYTLRYYDME